MTQTISATTRYAAIDAESGYVWGSTDNTPVGLTDDTAARYTAAEVSREADSSRWYDAESFTPCTRRDAAVTYHVYEIADDVEIVDGQAKETITAVEAGRYVGSVRYQADSGETQARRDV
jgi:hypothetical protein